MSRLVRSSLSLLIVVLPAACGGSVAQDGGSGGSGGSAAAAGSGASGGSAATGGGGGSGAVAGSGAAAGTGGVSCEAFDDAVPTGNVTLRIKNERSSPIYLGGENYCSPLPVYALSGPSGPVQHFAGGCGNTCEALQEHGDWCMDACLIPPVVVINPGGSYDASWSGTTFEPKVMPKTCYFEPEFSPTSCDRRIVAPSGTYVASVEAATELLCNDVAVCSCTPNAQGSCEIPYGGTPSGSKISAKASFSMPSESLVVLTFQ